MSKLFEFAVLYHPRQTKENLDKGITLPSEIIRPVQTALAKDIAEVQILAARQIPDAYLDKLDTVEIAIRPF